MRLTILSRSSELARVQARLVGRALQMRFPDVELAYDTRTSAGDRDPTTPLASLPDKGAFTADLSSALASGAADLVVHSWKDLPLDLPAGHVIGGTLKRADPRDVLLVRRDVVAERPPTLRVLSSSPRRAWLLRDVLPSLLPWRASVEIVEVRGNVPTRIGKLLDGHGDALAVAKAALDRLLDEPPVDEPSRAGGALRQQIGRCAWMVLPIKDVPTAPAQGALAIETSAANTVVRGRLDEITHRPTWDAVCRERDVLAQHGGGCHQALGATILARSYGTITSVRARAANGCVMTWSLASEGQRPPRTSVRYIWPRPGERGQGQRAPLDVPPPSGTPDLWISRTEALPQHWTLSPQQVVWAAGGNTWRKLAARGVWVNGCADGLGDEEDSNVGALAGRAPVWLRLTHAGAAGADDSRGHDRAMATYQVHTPLPDDLPQRTHFFWTSGALFREALLRWPEIANRWHASGPGRSSRVIRDTLGSAGQVRVCLEYDEWLKESLE